MSAHTYRWDAVCADGLRSAVGLTLVGAPLILGDAALWATIPLAAGGGVFVAFALAGLARMLTRVDVSPDAIAVHGPRRTRLAWAEIQRLRLAYYATRRDGRGGWMELTIADGRRRVVIDSRISGFELVTRRAVSAARARTLPLDGATVANLRDLGIHAGEWRRGEGSAS